MILLVRRAQRREGSEILEIVSCRAAVIGLLRVGTVVLNLKVQVLLHDVVALLLPFYLGRALALGRAIPILSLDGDFLRAISLCTVRLGIAILVNLVLHGVPVDF